MHKMSLQYWSDTIFVVIPYRLAKSVYMFAFDVVFQIVPKSKEKGALFVIWVFFYLEIHSHVIS